MNRMSKEAIDPKLALRSLPPLIKGYLRLGCYIGDGAVVDHEFGTTDVLIVLPMSAVKSRYLEHFGGNRKAA
jgi:putative hemolysin